MAQFEGFSLLIATIGAVLIILGCAYFTLRAAPRITRKVSLYGILSTGPRENELLPIERYRFSEEMADYLRGVGSENKALSKMWSEHPIGVVGESDKRLISPSHKLARELVEYFFLNQLSLHLNAYFIENRIIEDDEIITLKRRDIPTVLLENRVFELFSRPMEDREAFSMHAKGTDTDKIVYATGEGGAIFEHFELMLPKKTEVSRLNEDTIKIKTDRFSMQVHVNIPGWNANLPRHFVNLYMKNDRIDVTNYVIYLEFEIKFTLRSFLTNKGWEYFRWIDSFLEDIEEAFSFDHFLRDIGWDSALTIAKITSQPGLKAVVPPNHRE